MKSTVIFIALCLLCAVLNAVEFARTDSLLNLAWVVALLAMAASEFADLRADRRGKRP